MQPGADHLPAKASSDEPVSTGGGAEGSSAPGSCAPGGGPADARPVGWGGWTLPVLCAGIALIAACLIIPQADENRRQAYECMKLARDLDHLKQQAAANDEFIKRLGDDPALAERLAQRQMKYIRQGTAVLPLNGSRREELSPFMLSAIRPPEPLPPYQPIGGRLAEWCRNPRTQLYLMAAALLLVAMGLIFGYPARDDREPPATAI